MLGALGLLFGSRSDTSSIRTGTTGAPLKGSSLFSSTRSWLECHNLDTWDELIVRRDFRSKDGRVFINDTPVKLQLLQLGQLLVDLHGQDSAKLLLQRDFQLLGLTRTQAPPVAQRIQKAYAALKQHRTDWHSSS